jgi:hypothetical protein
MSNLAEKWNQTAGKCSQDTITLRPTYDVLEGLETARKQFPHIPRNRMINDLLIQALENIRRIGG